MKITKVDVWVLDAGEQRGARYPICCRVYTDEGIYGDGEAALAYGESQIAAFGIVQNFAKLIIGMDPLQHEVIWDKLYRTTFWGQNGGPVIFAGISAIDIALWDIKGKYYNAPIYELLGGKRREKLRSYASQLQFSWGPDIIPQRTPDDYAREAKKAVAEGYDAIKIDFFTFKPDEGNFNDNDRLGLLSPEYLQMYEARVKAVREAIGPNVDLIIENHSFTDSQSAAQLGNLVKKYNIFYFEEPSTPTPQLSKFVHDETGLPIANGERIYTRWQYIEYFKQNAIQVIQPDVGTCGGITEIKKICDMAQVYDIGVQIHVCGGPIATAAALQLEATIPNFVIHEEHNANLTSAFVKGGKYYYAPKDGYYTVPELPGIGQEMSEFYIANAKKVVIE